MLHVCTRIDVLSWEKLISRNGCSRFFSCSLRSVPFLYGGFLLVMTEEWDGWEIVLGKTHWIMLFIRVRAYSPKALLMSSLFLIAHPCLWVKFQQWRSALISLNMPCFLCLCAIIHSDPSAWNSLYLLVHLLYSYFPFQSLTGVISSSGYFSGFSRQC